MTVADLPVSDRQLAGRDAGEAATPDHIGSRRYGMLDALSDWGRRWGNLLRPSLTLD
jgi:hypothetical protein